MRFCSALAQGALQGGCSRRTGEGQHHDLRHTAASRKFPPTQSNRSECPLEAALQVSKRTISIPAATDLGRNRLGCPLLPAVPSCRQG